MPLGVLNMNFGRDSGDVNLQKAGSIVKQLFESIYENLPSLDFRILRIEKNTEKDIWKVHASLFTSITSNKRVFYLVKVNVKTGEILSVGPSEKTE